MHGPREREHSAALSQHLEGLTRQALETSASTMGLHDGLDDAAPVDQLGKRRATPGGAAALPAAAIARHAFATHNCGLFIATTFTVVIDNLTLSVEQRTPGHQCDPLTRAHNANSPEEVISDSR